MNPPTQIPTLAFSETSRLFQPAFLFSFIPVLVFMAFMFFEEKADHDFWSMFFIALGALVSISVFCMMLLIKLSVELDTKGVSFTYYPYIRRARSHYWKDIQSASLITYNPIGDFGGWGLKKSRKYGQAYTTKGNKGLWVQLKDGKSFVLSITDVRQAQDCLSQIKERQTNRP